MYDNNGDIFGFTYNGTPYYYVKNAQNDVYLIIDENGYAQVLYQYDAWGVVTACYDATDFNLSAINPIMYRSYYVDLEMGMFVYYLNSRYYIADWGRFASADAYVQTGQGMLDKNMFAYCLNNPVNRVDANGKKSDALQWWAATMWGLCAIDTFLPIGDIIYWSGIVLLTVGCAITAAEVISQSTVAVPKEEDKAEEIAKDVTKEQDKPVYIYRHNGTNPGNLVPSARDASVPGAGLSFSTVPQPNSWKTTIEQINSTGVLYAVQDSATHVSVYPVGGTVSEWRSQGTSSIWTQKLMSVCTKVKWEADG